MLYGKTLTGFNNGHEPKKLNKILAFARMTFNKKEFQNV